MLKDLNITAVLPAADISRAGDFHQSGLQLDAPERLNEVFEDYDMPGLVTGNGVVTPIGQAGWFKDSEGNIFNLIQRG